MIKRQVECSYSDIFKEVASSSSYLHKCFKLMCNSILLLFILNIGGANIFIWHVSYCLGKIRLFYIDLWGKIADDSDSGSLPSISNFSILNVWLTDTSVLQF